MNPPNSEGNPETFKINFTVLDYETHEPIENAKVHIRSNSVDEERTTGSAGGCSIKVPAGVYTAITTHAEYPKDYNETTINIVNENITKTIYLSR